MSKKAVKLNIVNIVVCVRIVGFVSVRHNFNPAPQQTPRES
jgi:hypothetical protein